MRHGIADLALGRLAIAHHDVRGPAQFGELLATSYPYL